jgi:hypothetical protein
MTGRRGVCAAALGAAAMACAACHVTSRTEVREAVSRRDEPHLETARALEPTVVLADGAFRFVEPLLCRSDEVVELAPEIQRQKKPNLATFVVGVVATLGGAVAGISALADDNPGDNPLTYAGGAGIVVGLPLAIGPWIGNSTTTELGVKRTERRAGRDVPCGSRPITDAVAHLTIGEREVYAALGADGALAVSPFTWIDAFDQTGGPAFAVRAELRGRSSTRVVERVFEAGALAPWREAFLASTRLDVSVEGLRAVPRLEIADVSIGHVLIGSQETLRVRLGMRNKGPGEAWQVRVRIGAANPELDGRIVYLGHIAKNATTTGELWVPVSPSAGNALTGSGTGASVVLPLGLNVTDAHHVTDQSFVANAPVVDEGFQ